MKDDSTLCDMKLPLGLHCVLVKTFFESVFPPVTNSASDIALLRAANRAMQRKGRGVEDDFLFVVLGQHSREMINAAIQFFQNRWVMR